MLSNRSPGTLNSIVAFLQYLIHAGRGRPFALVLLAALAVGNYLSEDPLPGAPGSELRSVMETVASPFLGARQVLFDSYQRAFPRKRSAQPVTIVEIDEKSLKEIGQWPWPRNRVASLIDAIAGYGPAAIGLDVYMPEADQTSPESVARNLPQGHEALARALSELPSHESRLANSLRMAPTVLGAAGFDFETYTTTAGLRTVPIQVHGGDALQHVRNFPWVLASLPELQAAAHGQALLSVGLAEGIVRKIPLVMAVGDQLVPALAMEMLRVATNSAALAVSVGPGGITQVQVADLAVPTQAAGDVWLHFARRARSEGREISAADVLAGRAAPDTLAQKLVLVGLTGIGLSDMRVTALREQVPGIEIQAQVIESFFDGRFLHRPRWIKSAELGILLTFGLLVIWLVPAASGRFAVGLQKVPSAATLIVTGFNGVLIGVGYLLFWATGLLFDAAGLFIGLTGVVGGLVSSALIEIERRETQAKEAAQQEREAQALLALQDAAARRVRVSVPGLDTVRQVPAQIHEIASLHCPGENIGQNFFDAFMLDERRLALVVGSASGDGEASERAAALTLAVFKWAAHSEARDAAGIMAGARGEFANKNRDRRIVTAVLAIVDTVNCTLDVCNAGHESPWILRSKGTCTPLSASIDAPLSEAQQSGDAGSERYQLEAGDTVVFHAGGLLQARDPATNEAFGSERFTASITKKAESAEGIVRQVRDDLIAFAHCEKLIEQLVLVTVQRLRNVHRPL